MKEALVLHKQGNKSQCEGHCIHKCSNSAGCQTRPLPRIVLALRGKQEGAVVPKQGQDEAHEKTAPAHPTPTARERTVIEPNVWLRLCTYAVLPGKQQHLVRPHPATPCTPPLSHFSHNLVIAWLASTHPLVTELRRSILSKKRMTMYGSSLSKTSPSREESLPKGG